MPAEKLHPFLNWWYSVFATWDPDRLPSFLFWFLQDSQKENVPEIVAIALLLILICSLITIVSTPFEIKKGNMAFKLITIPIAFVGLIGLHFGNAFMEGAVMDFLPGLTTLFTEEIPALWQDIQPAIASGELPEIVRTVAAALLLTVFNPLIMAIVAIVYVLVLLLCLSPFIALLIANFCIFKWTGLIHFVADVGAGVLLILAAAVALFCYSFYLVGLLLVLYAVGGVMIQPLLRIVTIRLEYDPFV